MALPKQVEQQMAEVAEIERALAEHGTPVQTEEPVVEAPVVEPPAEVAPTEVVTPVVEVQKPAVPEAVWEQKYLTLKGMFDSQTATLHARVKELTHNLQSATGELEKLKTAPAPTDTRPTTTVTPDDEEKFGSDLIELQRRIASEAVTPFKEKLTTLEGENATLRELLGRTGSEVASISFEQRLQTVMPDFDSVNKSPQWIAWLDEIDPLSLEPRRAQAEMAYAAGNVAKVAHYVSMFRRDSTPQVPVTAPAPDTRQSELQSQVAPVRTQGSAAPATPTLKVYTEAEAAKLYDRVAMLNRTGKVEEGAKLDNELTAAYNSGRVR